MGLQATGVVCSEHVTLELSQAHEGRGSGVVGSGGQVSADDEAGMCLGSPGVSRRQHAVSEDGDDGRVWLVQDL